MVFGVHCGPVKSIEVTAAPMQALSRSRVTAATASATDEFGRPITMSTPPESYQLRAMAEPTSALFWWSA